MHCRSMRRKHGPSKDVGSDRAVITVVLLAVTFVLLILGFAGPSVYFVFPDPAGWLYIGVVIVAARGSPSLPLLP